MSETANSVDRIKNSPSYAKFVSHLGEEGAARLAESIALAWESASPEERDEITRKANASVIDGDAQASQELANIVGWDSQSSGEQPTVVVGLALMGVGFILLGASMM